MAVGVGVGVAVAVAVAKSTKGNLQWWGSERKGCSVQFCAGHFGDGAVKRKSLLYPPVPRSCPIAEQGRAGQKGSREAAITLGTHRKT